MRTRVRLGRAWIKGKSQPSEVVVLTTSALQMGDIRSGD